MTAELIITAGGENIPPVLLEDNILREIQFLSNVMVVGDKRPYLTCLMTLKVSLLLTQRIWTLVFVSRIGGQRALVIVLNCGKWRSG